MDHPFEILTPLCSLPDTMYTNIKRWPSMSSGGHFAALEAPDMLAADKTSFFLSIEDD